ncbi:unnamed protein product [Withania somnifera]
MATRVLLKCGDCGTLLNSPEEAQQHAKNSYHTNFRESNEVILHLVCTICDKICTCKTESNFHAKRTGHTEFQDRTAEVAEEKERRARENIRWRMAEINQLIKAQRIMQQFGLLSGPVSEEEKNLLPPATKAQQIKEHLCTIKLNHMDDEAKVKTAFITLLTFARNVATNPDEEKYRKIRISNAVFQDRVGKLQGCIEFLELCGFEKIEGGEFLYLEREKVDMDVLFSAGNELKKAIGNP